jgi:hypothetical protein
MTILEPGQVNTVLKLEEHDGNKRCLMMLGSYSNCRIEDRISDGEDGRSRTRHFPHRVNAASPE